VLKKDIKYTSFDGEEVVETFYFNLTQAELVELEMSVEGGLEAALKRIVADEDGAGVIREFKKIIKKAYGKKSADGKRFIKNEQEFTEFESSEPYSVLFMELVTDADAAAQFINGIVPKDLLKDNKNQTQLAVAPEPTAPKPTPRVLTRAEVTEMDGDELRSGLATGRYVLE
jgi:hypothetical protein